MVDTAGLMMSAGVETRSNEVTAALSAMAPTFSVVVPTHRRPESLRRLLASLEGQSFRDFEVIVVATRGDPAFTIVPEHTTLRLRVTHVPDDPTGGRSASVKRNHGAALARARWIALIDDDCVAHRDWLTGALPFLDRPEYGALEGRKEIPPMDRPTATWRGLQMLTRPRGYQTCNMFYRRDVFQEVGGFDPNLPYYLEDSDLAWTVLERGYQIPLAQDALVYHPAGRAAPWKELDDARRAVLMPYLFKKHPVVYRASNTRVVSSTHWLYILLYLALLACVMVGFVPGVLAIAGAVVLLMVAHTFKRFRGCALDPGELRATMILLPILPVVKLVQLYRGNLKHGVWLWT